MNPPAICPVCQEVREFHPEEMKKVLKGKVSCTECALEEVFYKFMAEVLDGEHAELVAELRARLEAEAEEEDDSYA